jgi:hypothetical protein
LDGKKNILYSYNKKKAIPNMAMDPKKMQFNPFYLSGILESEPNFTCKVSNKDWNLHVNFETQAMNETKMFEELTAKLVGIEKGNFGENYEAEIKLKMK